MRPHRPNPYQGPRVRSPETAGNPTARPWLASHVRQETRAEGKARRRREAEARAARAA